MSGSWKAERMSKESFPEYKMVKGLISTVKVVNDIIKWCSIIKMAAVTWGPNDLEVSRLHSTHSDIKSIQSLILIFSNPAPSHLQRCPGQIYCQLKLLIERQHYSDLNNLRWNVCLSAPYHVQRCPGHTWSSQALKKKRNFKNHSLNMQVNYVSNPDYHFGK